jgi:hypothetical protein
MLAFTRIGARARRASRSLRPASPRR